MVLLDSVRVSRVPTYLRKYRWFLNLIFKYEAFTLFGQAFQLVLLTKSIYHSSIGSKLHKQELSEPYRTKNSCLILYNLATPYRYSSTNLFWYSIFARHYSRNRWLLSLPRANKMFQFTRFPLSTLYIQVKVLWHDPEWVAPFGNLGIKTHCQLPQAYRRLSRPSSVLHIKASSVCP